MTTNVTKVKEIKALEGYTRRTDADIVARATAAQTGMTGNSNLQNLPVDLATFKTDIESFSALISEALDGEARKSLFRRTSSGRSSSSRSNC